MQHKLTDIAQGRIPIGDKTLIFLDLNPEITNH